MPDINGIPYVESSDLVSAYPTVSQDLAQEVSDQLASKVDYALPVNAQTGTTYTFVAADAEKLTTASNASPVTLTIPPASSVAWPDNTVLRVVNYGAGAVTIDGGSGVTVTNTSSTIAQYGAAVAIRTGSDAWTVVPFGGGDVPSATVSSPAATGQYTDGGGQTWDYYTFTSSGTLTCTAGLADVLVVGGGGGGSSNSTNGGGGGAGGHLEAASFFLPEGALAVTVGAGGAGSSANGTNGVTSRLGDLFGVGGGGGGFYSVASSGGSGGGIRNSNGTPGNGISGQGNDGQVGSATANVTPSSGGGGGGAGGTPAAPSLGVGGDGGGGVANSYTGSSVTRAGGGGGAGTSSDGSGGSGGGGAGTGASGTANTGGGGGAGGGNGGSGIVIVRVAV